MTLPRRGGPRHRQHQKVRRSPDWSVAEWTSWEPLPDPQIRRRLRRQVRAQRLMQQRAEVAAAALRHPSMYTGPADAA